MRNLRFYYDEYKKQLAEIKTFIQSVELQKDVISELEISEKAGNNTLNLSLQYSKIIKQVVESPIRYMFTIMLQENFQAHATFVAGLYPFNTDDEYHFYIENYGNEVVDLEIFVEIFKKIGDNLSCIARYYEEMATFVPDYD